MTPQQMKAHIRMMGSLSVRTHVGVLKQDDGEPRVKRDIKKVEVDGVIYKSQVKAIEALGLSKWQMRMMIESGKARLIQANEQEA